MALPFCPPSTVILISLFICSLVVPHVHAVCSPAIPTPNGSINPAVYNDSLSSFSTFVGGNANQTSLLNLYVQWGATANRTINWVGIGATNGGECVPDIHGFVSGTFGGWTIAGTPDASCNIVASASYLWPQALYDTACQADFAITTNATYQSISFNIFVDYTDCSYVTRDSNNITECNDVTTNLPVTILFPLTTTVSTSATAVFSASSVQLSAALESQSLVLTNPGFNPTATFTFVTFVGEAFDLSANFLDAPAGLVNVGLSSVNNAGDSVSGHTRVDTWSVSLSLNVGVCNIDGNYSVNFTVYYTGYNGTGSTLPPDQNPIPLNSSALVTFVLHSADFCANFIHPDISAVLNTYNQNLTDYYTGPTPPWQGFLTGNTIYLAARVTSDNLPILSAAITTIYTSTSTDPTLTPLNTANPLLHYGTIAGGDAGVPRTDVVCWFTLDRSVFQVPGDQNIQYIFTTDIVVTYNNDGQRKRDVEQRTFRLRDAAADITADTQALIGAGLDTSSTSTTSLATSSAACAFLVSVLAAALLCVV